MQRLRRTSSHLAAPTAVPAAAGIAVDAATVTALPDGYGNRRGLLGTQGVLGSPVSRTP